MSQRRRARRRHEQPEKQRAAIAALFASSGAARRYRRRSGLLDFLEHLENALLRADKKTLVGFAEAAALERVAAGSGSFGHGITSLRYFCVDSRTADCTREAAAGEAAAPDSPAADFNACTLSVASHVNSGSSRPKWPYAAVLR